MAKPDNKQAMRDPKTYQQLAKAKEPPRPAFRNCIRAFLVGGFICLIGECVQYAFVEWFDFSERDAGSPTVAVMIIIAVLLTGFGVYDKIAQWAGAGSAVPVTGFANSMTSAAIEHKSEGFILGVGGKMFKLAGPVIVYGVVAAFVVGLAYLAIHPDLAAGGR